MGRRHRCFSAFYTEVKTKCHHMCAWPICGRGIRPWVWLLVYPYYYCYDVIQVEKSGGFKVLTFDEFA